MAYADKDEQNAYNNEWLKQRRREWIRSVGGACRDCGSRRNVFAHWTGPLPRPRNLWSMSPMRFAKVRPLLVPVCKACVPKYRRLADDLGIPHGKVTGYKHYGCRCAECTRANREWVAGRRKALRESRRPPTPGDTPA